MSSPGVGLKNNQVPSQRQILEWGEGDGNGYYFIETCFNVSVFQWSLRGSQRAKSQENHTWGSRNGLSKDPGERALCLVRTEGGYLVGAGELWIRSRVNRSSNKSCSQRARAEYGFLPLRLLCKSPGRCRLQMLLCGNFVGWEVIFVCSLFFIGCPQLSLMLCVCAHLNPEEPLSWMKWLLPLVLCLTVKELCLCLW